MTPAEREVIKAAIAWSMTEGPDNSEDASEVLQDQVAVLLAERARPPAATENTRTWSQVVAEDEIYSTKTEKWYRVVETYRRDGRVMMRTEGMAKAKAMDPDARVRVRRSEMGHAVDVWAGLEVISS